MKKLLLVDGNSMVFRAFYATIYTRPMITSFGQPTNAVFGFANMVNKALQMLQPDAILFAFDSGKKTFRHHQYPQYKGTRKELPQELIDQFQLIRQYLDASNYPRIEVDGYEADDIIGTMAVRYPQWQTTILTSDRDLLQLIDDTTSVILMKKGITELEHLDKTLLKSEYGLQPEQIPDLKGLMGDPSDNIPGIPKVGEKTAMKLLEEYHNLENILENVHQLKGKLKETVEENIEIAKLSKELATIYKDVPLDIHIDQLANKPDLEGMGKFFRQYEMRSLDRMIQEIFSNDRKENGDSAENETTSTFDESFFKDDCIITAHLPVGRGYRADCSGFVISDQNNSALIEKGDDLQLFAKWLNSEYRKVGYDVKLLLHIFDTWGLTSRGFIDDIMLLTFLDDTILTTQDKLKDKWGISVAKDDPKQSTMQFARVAAKEVENCIQRLKEKDMWDLYFEIELPLLFDLYEMERWGILIDQTTLDDISVKTLQRINDLSERIYFLAGSQFNINSPKQLAEVLFDQLQLPSNSKRSTAVDVLEDLAGKHPVVDEIIEYRKYQKLYSTYAEGLKKYVESDSKIHTVFSQISTQTGRLSSVDPNLQNISIRSEETREIRKAFIAKEGWQLLSADYSQIELRILAHIAQETAMIEAFSQGMDIHTKTAMDVFNVDADKVTSLMRRQAKAVNFGIIYGISDFGLAAQLSISRKEAAKFIEVYLDAYPQIQQFMDRTVDFCKENGYVKTLFNRRREIPEINDRIYSVREFGKRAAMNAPIQGSAADLIKVAMLKVAKQLKEKKLQSHLLLQVHDELLLEVAPKEMDAVKQLVVQAMQEAVSLNVPLEVSTAFGVNWYEAK
ncbi:MAG: DNA polymerase I [Firmicutes bacterium HGW-Firmicutes-19]|jgi:DNA polymerase I|nr:MAG: DNA polymerase I [Firmicutes bacterium HGW-Firmicutes-19]